jgi:integrase
MTELPLAEGRRLYEEHIGRPRVTGGVKESTKRRYRAVFDKFLAWGAKNGVGDFRRVDANALNRYAASLGKKDYAQKTLYHELTTLKQCVKWLIDAGHLVGCEPVLLKLRKVESQRAYCYKPAEVEAILQRCREVPELGWIGDAVTGLAFTGMRIEELTNLKWADVDVDNNRITLVDESGRGGQGDSKRTLKSGRNRSLPLYSDLAALLAQLPKIDAYVFHGPNGRRLKSGLIRRMLVKDVLKPLAEKFPAVDGRQSFIDGRLHSFRHYFVRRCAAGRVSERVVMEWVGHADSAMVRHYFHVNDEEEQRQLNGLNLLSGAAGCSVGQGLKS